MPGVGVGAGIPTDCTDIGAGTRGGTGADIGSGLTAGTEPIIGIT
jgi:hypothetical protein